MVSICHIDGQNQILVCQHMFMCHFASECQLMDFLLGPVPPVDLACPWKMKGYCLIEPLSRHLSEAVVQNRS